MKKAHIKFAALCLSALVLTGCQGKQEEIQRVPLVISTITLTEQVSINTREFNGQVIAAELTPLSFPVEGEITELLVKPGEQVKQGQLLARLDNRKLIQQLSDAIAQHDLSYRQLTRAQRLLGKNLISQAEFDELQANNKKAKANHLLVKKQLNDSKLYAPFTGQISDTAKESFESVTPGETVVTLYQSDKLHVKFQVPDSLLAQFNPQIAPQDRGGNYQPTAYFSGNKQPYAMSYLEHTSEPTPQGMTFDAWLTMPQTQPPIMPGTAATIKIDLNQAGLSSTDGYRVPMTAVVPGPEAGHFVVWKVKQGKAYQSQVEINQIHTSGVLIAQGVSLGDQIITSGQAQLRDSQPVITVQQEHNQ